MRRSACFLLLLLGGAFVSAHSIPVGFMTFFNAASCPTGWTELGESKGRLIVSVTNSTDSGVTVESPLANKEDRTHTHTYSSVSNVVHKDIAAIADDNHQAAEKGQYTIAGTTQPAASGYPFAQLRLCSYDGSSPNLHHQGGQKKRVPTSSSSSFALGFGTVGFFAPTVSACPVGWQPMADAQGRILVPGHKADGGMVRNDAKSFSSGEKRKHQHHYNFSIPLREVEFVGVDGCCNGNPAKHTPIPVSGETDEHSSNLPYIQLLTCVNQQESFRSHLPSNGLLFNAFACPSNWTSASSLAGTFLVALPENGDSGAKFGGSPILAPKEGSSTVHAPEHHHTINGTLTMRQASVMLDSGCCGKGYGGSGTYVYSAPSDETKVELPFTMLPLCQMAEDKNDVVYVAAAGQREEVLRKDTVVDAMLQRLTNKLRTDGRH